MKTKGFTLIELLVVIAIIAVLAAILFPVFAAAREMARQTTCASNLKQIGTAVTMYRQDYDEAFPPYYDIIALNPARPYDHTWPGTLRPYTKSLQIWVCPSDPAKGDPLVRDHGSYHLNAYLSGWCNMIFMNACGRTPCDATPLTEASIPFPTTTVIMTDGTGLSYLTPWTMWCDIWSRRPDCYPPDHRHHGGANALFVDSHVKWTEPLRFRSDNPDRSWFRVEQTSCWFPYQRNDGEHPWFKP